MPFRIGLATVLLVVGIAFASVPGSAADLAGTIEPPAATQAPDEEQLRSYVARRAVVYQIRASFDVIRPDEIELLLLADALNAAGPGYAAAEAELDRDLLSEGNYLLVSLKYLIAADGAAWPSDRPASSYANDALIRIAALQDELRRVVVEQDDPLPVMLEANLILAQSEGLTEPVEGLDFFSDRDAIVEQVIEKLTADT